MVVAPIWKGSTNLLWRALRLECSRQRSLSSRVSAHCQVALTLVYVRKFYKISPLKIQNLASDDAFAFFRLKVLSLQLNEIK